MKQLQIAIGYSCIDHCFKAERKTESDIDQPFND